MGRQQPILSESVEQKALRNSVVLTFILKDLELTTTQLKNSCRLVNKVWHRLTTTELLRRDSLQVRMTHDPTCCHADYCYCDPKLSSLSWTEEFNPSTTEKVKELHYATIEKPNKLLEPDHRNRQSRLIFSTKPLPPHDPQKMDLTALTKCLKRSPQWPTTSFQFIGGNLLGSVVAMKFLKCASKNIKTLTLTLHASDLGSPVCEEHFENIFTPNVLPHLEHLIIDDLVCTFEWNFFFETNLISLPKLKVLTLPASQSTSYLANYLMEIRQTIKMILMGSPNLVNLRRVSPPYFRPILDTGKLGAVTQIVNFDFDFPQLQSNLADCIDFARAAPPHLVHLKVVWPPRVSLPTFNLEAKGEVMRAINLILKSSATTLKELEVKGDVDDVASICPLVIPELINLKKLSFRANRPNEHPPKMMQVSWNFPTLHHFDWRHINFNQILLKNYCSLHNTPMVTILPLVHTMEMMETALLLCGPELFGFCPNVKILKLHCPDDGKTTGLIEKIVEFGQNLDDLELIFDRMTSDFQNLDATLTGLPEAVCHQIFCLNHCTERLTNFVGLRSSRVWLGSLKGKLKRLKICFTGRLNQWTRCSSWRRPFPLTFVSGVYAFQLVPSIEVTIVYDKNGEDVDAVIGVLQNVAPFVKILGV